MVLAGPYGNGSGLLVQRMIPGRSLEDTGPTEVGDDTLRAAWKEVARLHQAGIAHGDLGRHSVVVDDDGRPWLVDFDHATAAAPERLLQADLAELLVSEELGDAPGLWDELARRVASPAAEPAPDGDAQVRRRSSDPSR